MEVKKKTVYSVDDFEIKREPVTDSITINKTEKGYDVRYLIQEECPDSPRFDDNLGTMVCFHRRYDLGDKHDYKRDNYNSWAEVLTAIKEDNNNDISIILPLYLYDHSGISIKTFPHGYHGGWDCGQVGYMFITKEKIKEEYGEVTEKTIATAKKVLIAELKIYDMYIQGEVYTCIREQYDDKKNHLEYEAHGNNYGYDEAKEVLKEEF